MARQLAQVTTDVHGVVITDSGHNIALEISAALTPGYLDFFAER